jgi:hypothetical protein
VVTLMREIFVFAEDYGHEQVLTALIQRYAGQYAVEVSVILRSVRGGHGKVLTELAQFQRDLQRRRASLPDLLIVATDGNCRGFAERKREIDAVTANISNFVICAIPDPHIERWLLLDSAAFKEVVGKGCSAPDQKCERDRYKHLLREAVREAGRTPLLSGLEFAEPLVRAMDLSRAERADASLGRLLVALREKFEEWGKTA